MGQQIIDITATTTASPHAVFALLRDAHTWPTFSPLGAAEIEAASPDGQGAVGEIRVFRTGRYVSRERVVISDEPTRFSYELLSGLPLRDYRALIEITPTATGSTIRWRSTFFGKVPGTAWLFRLRLAGFIRELVDGLAAAAATAEASTV